MSSARPGSGNGAILTAGSRDELAWAYQSDPGSVRDHNEDFAVALVPEEPMDDWTRGPLFVVCDGLGGHAAGEVASRVAAEAACEAWASAASGPAVATLRAAVREANRAVVDAGLESRQAGMGTTVVALAFAGRRALIAHIGDSRAYHVRRGAIEQVTADHSRVAEMVRMRLLTPEQAVDHPGRSMLTRSLGADLQVQVDIEVVDVEAGDGFLLCSDGLWERVGRSELAPALTGPPGTRWDASAACRALVGLALDRGAPDNVTGLVVRVEGDRPFPGGAARRSLFRRGRG